MRLTSQERDAANLILDDAMGCYVVVAAFGRLADQVGDQRATHVANVAWRLRRIRNGRLVRSLGKTGSGLGRMTLAALDHPDQLTSTGKRSSSRNPKTS